MLLNDVRRMITAEEQHPRNLLLDQVETRSNEDFALFTNIIEDRKVVSFYEQNQTRALKKVCCE